MQLTFDKKAICDAVFNLVDTQASLKTIKHEISTLISQPFLPSILENYVEYKYFKYCIQLLEVDIKSSDFLAGLSTSELQQVTSQIFSSRKLENLPNCITRLIFYKLIWEERRLLSDEDKQAILFRIQVAVAFVANSLTSSAQLKQSSLATYMKLSKQLALTLKAVIQRELENDPSISQHPDFEPDHIWKYVKKGNKNFPAEEYEAIHSKLKDEIDNFVKREFGNEISLLKDDIKNGLKQLNEYLLTPAKIAVEYKQGRHILTVKQPVILSGTLLTQVEENLSAHPEVEEVHFVAAEVMYIDNNLKRELWHGKNVLVISKKIEAVVPGLVWDLSGDAGRSVHGKKAADGTEGDIDGKDGENGQPGESGGYCTFIADDFCIMKRLTVKMKGGSGGNGQSGGHGRNGKDGKNGAEMSLSRLLSEFDSPAKTKGADGAAVRKVTIPNLKKVIDRYENNWTSGIDLDTGKLTNTGLYSTCTCYIRGYTRDGMLIELGDYENDKPPFYITRHAYCLVRGAPGTPGELGGFGGCKGAGGKGGYGGSFAAYKLSDGGAKAVCKVSIDSTAGNDGENGRDGNDGANGRCGKNGGDVGYVDNMWWKKAETYGPGGTYQLVDFSSEQNVSAWCGYKDKWRSIRTATRDPPQALQNNRQRKNKVTEKVAATRKNAVDYKQAMNEYAQDVKRNFTVGVDMEEMEFQKSLKDVITKSKELVKKNQTREEKSLRKMRKIKISKPAPQTGRFKRVNTKQTRRSRVLSFLNGAKSRITDQKNEINNDKLLLEKFNLLEKIRIKMETGWKNHEKTKIDYVKHRTSGRDYASALHALFGTVNSLGYYEVKKGKRQEVYQNLNNNLDALLRDEEAQGNLKESLFAYFEDESEGQHGNSKKQSKKSDKEKSLLDKYCETFKKEQKEFNWDALLNDKKAIEEYIDFLGEPTVPFLISDLRLVANLYGIPTELYMSYDGSSVHLPMKQKITDDNDMHQESSLEGLIRIAVNEHHEFSRMVPIEKADWSEVHQQMNAIVREVGSLKDGKEMEEYFKMEKFGVTAKDQKNEEKGDDLDKPAVITAISDLFGEGVTKEEKLVVGTALQMWPELLLTTYYNRIVVITEINKVVPQEIMENLKRAFGKVTEAILNGNDDDISLAPYLWIIATCPIEQWTLEMCLFNLQEHFLGVKYIDILIWRRMMTPFPSKLVECIGKLVVDGGTNDFDKSDKKAFNQFIKWIKEFEVNPHMDFSKLEGIDRTHWPFQLRKLFIASRVEKLPNVLWDDHSNKQTQALYYLHALYNEKPTEVKSLLDQLHVILGRQRGQATVITQILQNFYGGLWSLNMETIDLLERSKTLKEWMDLVMKKSLQGLGQTRSLEEIQKIIENDSNCTIPKDDLLEVVRLVKSMDSFKIPSNLHSNFQKGMEEWLQDFQKRIKGCNKIRLSMFQVEAVAYINFVIQMKLGYSLRPTQKLAILVALHQGSIKDSNLLSQIATGEGKTCIVLAVAICRGLFGEKTDVVTSSGVLAQRDATLYKEIYGAFNLTVGEVTSELSDDRRKAYLCSVVYGEASHFERDYLLDRFYNQNIRGSRPFGNIIVDEVDSMFLDKGNSVLYLSHQPPDLDSLEGIFVFIWTNVVQLVNCGEYHPMKVQELVLSAMYPTITVDDLLLFLSEREVNKVWEWLVDKKVVNSNGRLLMLKNGFYLPSLPEKFHDIMKQLSYLINRKFESSGHLQVFNYLKPFVEQHLFTWIHSAYQATQLTEGKEYVVDVDHSKTVLDKNPRIMILDLDTGVDMKESQWNEALHQFLQLKHGCRLSLMNLKAVFISNITFFNKYDRIFGLTGTIGTESDRQFLKDTYKVKVLCIPLAQPKQFIEQEPVICETTADWKVKVLEDAYEKTTHLGRSVLVVCGTVQEAEVLFAHFKSQGHSHVQLYRRDYEQFQATEEGRSLAPGEVLIATNLAGRGTDIKLSQKLRENGGLHVILSYLPDNLRVEQQAFGRAARCGDPGSGRLIFVDQVKNAKKNGDAIDMKIQRDELEISRVSDIQNYYDTVILKEEEMFKMFQQSFEELTGTLEKAYKYVKDHQDKNSDVVDESTKLMNGDIAEMKELVMYSMLNDWAYWLDKYSTILLNKNNQEHATLFDKGLHKFDMDQEKNMQEFMKMTGKYELVKEKYQDPSWLQSTLAWSKNKVGMRGDAGSVENYALTLIHEPALLVKVAKVKIERGQYEEAESYLDKVIRNEPENGRVAKYYKLFCKVRRGTWGGSTEFERLKEEVVEALDDWRVRQSTYASAVTQIQSVGNKQSLHGEGYKKQKENVIRLIGTYLQSVQSMVGNERLMASDFGTLCGEQVGEHLIKYLVGIGALRDTMFATNVQAEKLKKLADGFCMGEDELREILGKFNGRRVTAEVERELKNETNLPSRGGFWKEIQGCLENVESFAVVQAQSQIEERKENEVKCEKNEYVGWAKKKGVEKCVISKYGIDMGPTTNAQSVMEGDKAKFQKEQKFRFLRNSGRLCYEQVGVINVDKLEKLKLSKYCKIKKDSFSVIEGVSTEESIEIVEILKEARIVDEDGELLTTEWAKEKVDLTDKWEVYRGDILSILQSKCRYKYEVLSILFQAESLKTDENISKEFPTELRMSLPSKPCKDFIMTCLELGIIQGHRANPSYFDQSGVGNFFMNVVREPMSWAKWVGKKTGIVGTEKAKLTLEDLVTLFPEENGKLIQELYTQLKDKSWVNSEQELILDLSKNENFHLSPKFEYHQSYLLSEVQWRQEKVKENFLKDALKNVFESQGKLKTLENPDVNLVDIEEHLSGTTGPASKNAATVELTEEIATLTLSGFDHVIDTIERTYTAKMIFSAIAIIIIGLAQIALGVYLELITLGFGTFIASGLVAEGISDVIYGLMAFKSGHFSWQDWVDHKWRSIAITATTIGIGALLAKGIKYSKFGEKLFGSFGKQMGGRAIQETLKEGGKAGIKRSILPIILKSFGYKVIQGCAIAMGSMAVSYAYDKALKKFVDHVCAKIFANTHEAVKNHQISDTLSELCAQCGVAEAQAVVDRCSQRVMANSTVETDVHQHMSLMLTPLMSGLREATDKMNRAGMYTNQESMVLMLMMRVCAGLMTAASVVDSLGKMKESVKKYIDQVEREIKREFEILKAQQVGQQQREMATEREKEDFVFQFKERTNELMKQRIGGIMQHTIIEPLMNVGCQKLLWSIGRTIRGTYREYREGQLLEKVDKIKFELNQNPDAPEEVKRDLHKQVLQLCCQSRDPKVIAHAVEFGGPLGVESVQALANMLGVTIVVQSNNPNIPQVFEPQGGGGGNGNTLHLKHTVSSDDPNDLGHWESVSGGGGEGQTGSGALSGSPDCLLDALNSELKVKFGDGGKISRGDLANFMRTDENFKEFVNNGWHHTFNSIGGFGGAAKAKKYEEAEVRGEDKDNMVNRLEEKRRELREQGRMRTETARDRLDPIHEFATENVDGRECAYFVSGEVTIESMSNKQSRKRPEAKEYAMEGECKEHSQAGHLTPVSWGALTAFFNLFAQNGSINNSVNKSVEKTVTDFVRENPESHTVEYISVLENFGGRTGRWAGALVHYFRFKVDGEFQYDRVFRVDNPACNCRQLERRNRAPGGR